MLLHFDADTNNSILKPTLTRALNEGKIGPIYYAQILDRHLSGDFTEQIYWAWPDSDRKKYAFTEDDIPQIIKLRESIGIYGSELKQESKGNYWILRNTFYF